MQICDFALSIINIIIIIISTNERTNERTGTFTHAHFFIFIASHQCINWFKFDSKGFKSFSFFLGLGLLYWRVCVCVYACDLWVCVCVCNSIIWKGTKKREKELCFRSTIYVYVCSSNRVNTFWFFFSIFFFFAILLGSFFLLRYPVFVFRQTFGCIFFCFFFCFVREWESCAPYLLSVVLVGWFHDFLLFFFLSIGTGDCMCVCVSGCMIYFFYSYSITFTILLFFSLLLIAYAFFLLS